MVSSEAGKGSVYRPVDRKKYDRNYLRLYGKVCPECNGVGRFPSMMTFWDCERCKGLGYVERIRNERKDSAV